MNDLRSRHRTLAPVPSIGPKTGEIVSTPPKKRPKKGGNPLFQSSRPEPDVEAELEVDEPVDFATRATPDLRANSSAAGDTAADGAEGGDDALTFRVSREVRTMSVSIAAADREGAEGRLDDESDDGDDGDGKRAPASRPTRRREVMDADDPEDDKFPWHYQFHDDEPEELQAKSPLLSRAFRSSVG